MEALRSVLKYLKWAQKPEKLEELRGNFNSEPSAWTSVVAKYTKTPQGMALNLRHTKQPEGPPFTR